MNGGKIVGIALAVALLAAAFLWLRPAPPPGPWSAEESRVIRSLWLENLSPPPARASNAVAESPLAARLGHRLFFDKRLSGNGEVSCASCHQPERDFTDGLPTARAIGASPRNTPSLIGAAYSPWLYWDGRKDSLWSQALAPLEDPAEHGGDRHQYVRLIATDPVYREAYEALFGRLPPKNSESPRVSEKGKAHYVAEEETVDRVFANLGKAIAAYERQLLPGPSRFDAYVEALVKEGEEAARPLLSAEARRGLRLFIGEARCVECHNGPLFTNNEFHNTGLLPPAGEEPDRGRSRGLRQLREDPFNCLGEFSDDPERHCPELRFAREGPDLLGAMRTPSLRTLARTAPFMHKGQFDTLDEVLEHYNRAPLAVIGHNEAEPLGLSGRELAWLKAFLESLQAPPAVEQKWLEPPESYSLPVSSD